MLTIRVFTSLSFCLIFLLLAGVNSSAYAVDFSTGYYPAYVIHSYSLSSEWSGEPNNIKINDNIAFISTYGGTGNTTYIRTNVDFPTIPENSLIKGFNFKLRAKHDGGTNTGGGGNVDIRKSCTTGNTQGSFITQPVGPTYSIKTFFFDGSGGITPEDINNNTACFIPNISIGPSGVNYYDYFEAEVIYEIPEATPTPTPTPTPSPTATPTPTSGLNVPLLKQGITPYDNNDPTWEDEAYDHAPAGCETIAFCGCFTTSIAMIFQYHGITKLPDGTLLDPGTLNTWLTNNNGYNREGSLVPSVAATLAKKAKAQNPGFTYDGLEYSRFSGDLSQSKDQLKTDIENENPGILHIINDSVPTHFIVAMGIDGETFNINDPARNTTSLAFAPYNNSFDSLRRFIPSNTDLSYITLAVDPDINIVLKNSNGESVGDAYFEYPLQDPALPSTSTSSEPSLKILEFPKPSTDDYTIEVTSPNSQTYQLDAYLIAQEGDTKMETFSGQVAPGITNAFDLSYDKESTENTNTQPLITPFTLRSDLQTLYEQGLIDNQGVYKSLKLKVNLAIAASYVRPVNLSKKLTILALKTFLYELNYQRGRHVSEEAYQILKLEADYLIAKLKAN